MTVTVTVTVTPKIKSSAEIGASPRQSTGSVRLHLQFLLEPIMTYEVAKALEIVKLALEGLEDEGEREELLSCYWAIDVALSR